MTDLDTILEVLRRQREDLEEIMSSTASRSSEAAALVSRIEDLRKRAEETLRQFSASNNACSQDSSSVKGRRG